MVPRPRLRSCTLALWLFVVGACQKSEPRFSPEHVAFRTANQQIETYDGLQSFGNSTKARDLAARFGRFLVAIREDHFEAPTPDSLPTERPPVLTYCRLRANSVCFLSNMPELAFFPDDSRQLLAELSWQAARAVIGLELPPESEIAIGLRGGGWFFGATAIGTVVGTPTIQAGTAVDSEVLYRFFPAED